MALHLFDWILALNSRFLKDELEKKVAKAKVTIGLVDATSGEIQYHVVEYTAKK